VSAEVPDGRGKMSVL